MAAPKKGYKPKSGPRGQRPNHRKDPVEKLYGKHSVKAVLMTRPSDIKRLMLAGKPDYHTDIKALAAEKGVDAEDVSWSEFKKIGQLGEEARHGGVLALTKPRQTLTDADFDRLEDARCVLVLDQVSNPQNLATILRSAAFFKADAVIYMRHRAATPTPEVTRLAVGGADLVDLYCVVNLAKAIDDLIGLNFQVLGLDERGEKTLADHDFTKPTALVIGAEGEGLRKKTRDHCTDLVRIPGGRDGLESLNAAVAATIALYEAKRL